MAPPLVQLGGIALTFGGTPLLEGVDLTGARGVLVNITANKSLKMKEVREVESRLVFTLRSLAKRFSDKAGSEIRLQADMEEQQVVLSGPGRFCGIACTVEARCQFVWDENAKTLRLVPLEQAFGGHNVPRWLWWAGRSPVPEAAVLDLGFSWIPFNIQEVHVGWDQVNLSTNW